MPSRARAAARLMAVVVLPTPPFWLTTAMTLEFWGGESGWAEGSGWGSGFGNCLLAGWMVIIGVGEGYREVGVVAIGRGCAEVTGSVENLWNVGFAGDFWVVSGGWCGNLCSRWNIGDRGLARMGAD